MSQINILTPIRENEKLSYDISKQTVKCKRFTVYNSLENRLENEAYNRNFLKKELSHPYTILMDADVVLLGDDTVEKMVKYMDLNINLHVAVVDTKNLSYTDMCRNTRTGHSVIALCIIRSCLLNVINFSFKNPEGVCLCKHFNSQVKKFTGLDIPYINNLKAIERGAK